MNLREWSCIFKKYNLISYSVLFGLLSYAVLRMTFYDYIKSVNFVTE